MNPTPPTINAPERREAVSVERAFEIRDAMIQVARNRAGVDGATQSQMREAQGEWLHGVLNELPAARPSETYAEWQQKRGMLADTIDWAINEYDEFMKNDAYNAQAVLDRIIAKLRDRNALLAASSGERGAAGTWADSRLGQAYDLVEAVRAEWPNESGVHDGLTIASREIENTDLEIGSLKR